MSKTPTLQQTFTFKRESEPVTSCSTLKFMFQCLKDIYWQNEWADSGDSKNTKISIYLL